MAVSKLEYIWLYGYKQPQPAIPLMRNRGFKFGYHNRISQTMNSPFRLNDLRASS
jgi:hypothetical protein